MIKRHPILTALILLVGVILFTCIGGPVVLWFLGGGRPNIAVDYVAKLNERAAAVPEADRAWPIYLEAIAATPESDFESDFKELIETRPGEPNWDECASAIRERQAVLELTRRAAAKPGLGYVSGSRLSDEYSAAKGWDPEPPPPAPATSPPVWVINVLLPQLGDLRYMSRLLAADSRLASVTGDAERIVANTEAMLGIAGHAGEHATLINQLVEIGGRALACKQLRETIADHPGLFNDSQLASLDAMLADLDEGGEYRLDMTGERMFMDDTIQRMYTDDGNGDGYITPSGIETLGRIDSLGLSTPTVAGRIGAGLARLFSSSRAEVVAMYDAVYVEMEVWAEVPLWERGEHSPAGGIAGFERRTDASRLDMGVLMISILMPALESAFLAVELSNHDTNATRLVISLERARLADGAWPDSLDELTPAFLDEIPPDPFDGAPMKYLVTEAGPVLYSIGTDRDDDGGRNTIRARKWKTPEQGKAAAAAEPDEFDGDWVFFPFPIDDD